MGSDLFQNINDSCTSLPTNIDGAAGPRTNALMDILIASFNTKTLQEEYGVDAHVVPFTRDFPPADIYELISSDLLYKLSRGHSRTTLLHGWENT